MSEMEQSRYERLAERAQQERPESWIPENEGDMIVGEFLRLESQATAFDPSKPQPIVVLKTEDGAERSVWLLHSVLKNEMARARPKPGELVAVTYLGKKQGQAGRPYAVYRVVVDRQEQTVNWDAIGDTPAPGWEETSSSDVPSETKVDGSDFQPAGRTDDSDIPF